MLDYLMNFIQQYIMYIVIIIIILAIISNFSKFVKRIFVSVVGLGFIYLFLLCLYELGIGIESLYQFSCRYIYMACELIEKNNTLLMYTDIPVKLMQFLSIKGICGIASSLYFSGLTLLFNNNIFIWPRIKIITIKSQINQYIKRVQYNYKYKLMKLANIFSLKLNLRV